MLCRFFLPGACSSFSQSLIRPSPHCLIYLFI
nr:MAG TPA: High potential iron-sulfur protein [Bacteriophage sp.]